MLKKDVKMLQNDVSKNQFIRKRKMIMLIWYKDFTVYTDITFSLYNRKTYS